MATQEDVRRIALSLPETVEADGEFVFSVVDARGKRHGFVWAWNERLEPRKPRVPSQDVLAVRVIDEEDKQALLASDPAAFFTEPHYNGFPAVLVRLPAIDAEALEELVVDAWRTRAPTALVEANGRGQTEAEAEVRPTTDRRNR